MEKMLILKALKISKGNKTQAAKLLGISVRTCRNKLKEYNIDFIVLAGFLLKIPENILYYYPNKIINIHPALLPKFGGKGMYGIRVHESVIQSEDKESGM